MSDSKPHVSICVCTYKRQRFLRRLLNDLAAQKTEGLFTYSVVVADNDQAESAREVVTEFAIANAAPVVYCVQPRQNIALTRNRAIENAHGDYIAFVDDDEFPVPEWLVSLFKACNRFKADGVLGSARPEYEGEPPSWVKQGKFYVRATHPTGFVINWRNGRTGNLLFKRSILNAGEPAFREEFLTGEDRDFFRRMIDRGHLFVWCDEALTREVIPASRWSRSFMIRRALLRGKISLLHPGSDWKELAKSALAIPAYSIALPLCLLAGQHSFMKYLIKTCDHLGRVLAAMGLDPIKEKYVTE